MLTFNSTKSKMLNIFSPRVFLKKVVDASWSCNLATPEEEKVPVEHIGGVPRLSLKYAESKDDWLCGVLALDKAEWKAQDLTYYTDVKFTFYQEDGVNLRVSFIDDQERTSEEVEISQLAGIQAGEECEVSIPLRSFYNAEFDETKGRLIKLIGVNKPHFYVSNLYLV